MTYDLANINPYDYGHYSSRSMEDPHAALDRLTREVGILKQGLAQAEKVQRNLQDELVSLRHNPTSPPDELTIFLKVIEVKGEKAVSPGEDAAMAVKFWRGLHADEETDPRTYALVPSPEQQALDALGDVDESDADIEARIEADIAGEVTGQQQFPG